MANEIDMVIPMVFPQDPEWQREHLRCRGGDPVKHVRWRSWGTEELQVRCVMKNMPWLRRVYILLAQESQVQPWLQAPDLWHGKISIVFHRDFMPQEYLPCFSSPCLEMFLKDIPGLSEQFVYANDDMFPLSPLEPDDFFRDGLPCQHVADRTYPANPGIFHRKCMWQQNMIAKPFGKHFTRTYPDTGHTFSSILKSSCEEVWRRHGEEIAKHLSPLRRTDRSANNWTYLLYQQYSGRYVDHLPPYRYIDSTLPLSSLPSVLRDPSAGIVCLNDSEHLTDWRQRASVARREIAARLSLPRPVQPA